MPPVNLQQHPNVRQSGVQPVFQELGQTLVEIPTVRLRVPRLSPGIRSPPFVDLLAHHKILTEVCEIGEHDLGIFWFLMPNGGRPHENVIPQKKSISSVTSDNMLWLCLS